MEVKDILNEWKLDNSKDENIFEYLEAVKPNNCYFIDRFPLLIDDFNKYQQEEIYYEKVLNKEISKEYYQSEERKFINVIKKLWLYNNVIIDTNFLDIKFNNVKRYIEASDSNTIYNLQRKLYQLNSEFFTLDDIEELNLLVKLGMREQVYSIFTFLDYGIIVETYGMCFQVYLNDLLNLEITKNIICTEGLYLRPKIV